MATCARRRDEAAQLASLEAAVAGAAGLAMVFCAPALRLAPAYMAFVERLTTSWHRRARPLLSLPFPGLGVGINALISFLVLGRQWMSTNHEPLS